ncbi:MAG: glycosyltransferase family 4 protein [Bacillota bacterium]
MGEYAYIFGLAMIISLLATPLVSKLAFKLGAVDRPDNRKVHSRLMPRLGGLAIYLGFTVTVLFTADLTRPPMIGLLLGGSIIVLLGILDDIRDISPRMKLLGQIVAAAVAVSLGIRVDFITNPFGGTIPLEWQGIPFGIPLTILWIVGITNALNLIDGLDGLAGGLSAIAALTLAVIGWREGALVIVLPALVLAASTIGFLRYNFYPARIFMGDSGSMFLGFILACLSVIGLIKTATVVSVFIPILILGIPIFDTLFAIIRRYFNNQPIFKADKEHLHHRLLEIGLSHRQTVLVIYGVNMLLGASAIWLTAMATDQAVLISIGLILAIFFGADRIGVLRSKPAPRRNLKPEGTGKNIGA